MRIGLYARVSTDDKGQDPENQLRQLRQWCADAGHELVHEYVDRESGRKGVNGRKQFAALFEDAHKRKFDCVLFRALDRFTREGMVPTIMHLQRLASHGVGFHSYTEPHLATDNELVRNILPAPSAGSRRPTLISNRFPMSSILFASRNDCGVFSLVDSRPNILAMPSSLDTIPLTFPCALAIVEASSRLRAMCSLETSTLRCVRFACSAWSSRTLSSIGLTRLNNLEAAASAGLPLLQLG